MTYIDKELPILKENIQEMMLLIHSQLVKARQSLLQFDKDLAREVLANEKRVNAMELNIDRECENFFALYTPVAIDLRFVLACLKINTNLERIGDMAEGIVRYVIEIEEPFDRQVINISKLEEMFAVAELLLSDMERAFNTEDSKLARTIFTKDEALDEINNHATDVLAEYIQQNPLQAKQALQILSMVRKLERVGDQSKNIAEEIIFYIEAKVLKHTKKKIERGE